ncbi:MAG: hypothetical protein Q7U04_13145 [Bacteriovorax sp.]|nr:hypothetical protein [Bacteriovorax sp.]
MYGGLARHPLMTEEAFAVVVCHELGHHLGGAPKKRQSFSIDPLWSSNEGEADYFSSLKCLRKFFTGLNNQDVLREMQVPKEVIAQCLKVFPNIEETLICQRSAMAGFSVGLFLKSFSKVKKEISFSSPEKKRVLFTNNSHPSPQCRLDTYFQAALCDKHFSEELSSKDLNIGACTLKNGDQQGIRPRCWMAKH